MEVIRKTGMIILLRKVGGYSILYDKNGAALRERERESWILIKRSEKLQM